MGGEEWYTVRKKPLHTRGSIDLQLIEFFFHIRLSTDTNLIFLFPLSQPKQMLLVHNFILDGLFTLFIYHSHCFHHMDLDVTRPVLGVSGKVRLQPACRYGD